MQGCVYPSTGSIAVRLVTASHRVSMDCRGFRKQHFAYLDDTLPGNEMAEAQRHIMSCDGCAAHDGMIRRSLMLVRNMAVIEPSVEFRQRMQRCLKETRAETQRERFLEAEALANPKSRTVLKQPAVLTALAATVLVAGTAFWRQREPQAQTIVSLQPVTVSTPAVDTTQPEIFITPDMVHAMSTGNPMWPAALMVDGATSQMVNSEFTQVKATR